MGCEGTHTCKRSLICAKQWIKRIGVITSDVGWEDTIMV